MAFDPELLDPVNSLICYACNIGFETSTGFHEHVIYEHTEQHVIDCECAVCNPERKNAALDSDCDSDEGPFTCNGCDINFLTTEAFSNHVVTVHVNHVGDSDDDEDLYSSDEEDESSLAPSDSLEEKDAEVASPPKRRFAEISETKETRAVRRKRDDGPQHGRKGANETFDEFRQRYAADIDLWTQTASTRVELIRKVQKMTLCASNDVTTQSLVRMAVQEASTTFDEFYHIDDN